MDTRAVRTAIVLVVLGVSAAGCGSSPAPHAARAHRHPAHHRPPSRRRFAPSPQVRVPILEYHVIGDPGPGARFPRLYLSVADFRSQLAWLARHGYQAVT